MSDEQTNPQPAEQTAEWWASHGKPEPIQLVGRSQILRALGGIIDLLEGNREKDAYILLVALRTVVQQDEALLLREDEQHTTH